MTSSDPRRHARCRAHARLLGVTLLIGLSLPLTSAKAESPALFGWWTSLNQGGLVAPPAVDIPPGGFEVTDAATTRAYAAIGHESNNGQVQSVVLKLEPTANSLPGSTVKACKLTSTEPFSPNQGAPIDEGPAFDCTSSVPALVSADGLSVSFAVAPLVRDGYLGIAIVANASSRLVFQAPGDDAVRASSGEAGPTSKPLPEPTEPAFPAPSFDPGTPLPDLQPGSGEVTQPGTELPPTVELPAPSLAPPGNPTRAADSPALATVSVSTPTIGIGKTVIGAGIVVLMALGTWSQNRQLAQSGVAGGESEAASVGE